MADTIFYSWQSDLPNSTNRSFIQTALERALKAIREDESVQVDPVVDRDTEGEPGSPDISSTILQKIDKAQALVCDVSIINSTQHNGSRLVPNPNVLIELGYALNALGQQRIIMVMNTAFGEPEKLPFDLRMKRTVTYRSATGDAERATERSRLQGTLEVALRTILRLPRRHPKKTESHDHRLFQRFLNELPSRGSINFLRDNNFAGFSFLEVEIDPLRTFRQSWNDADHEFDDQELESQRADLYALVDQFLLEISTNTFEVEGRSGRRTVPQEWEITQRDHFFEVCERLHILAEQIVNSHQSLIRLGRSRLGISSVEDQDSTLTAGQIET